jgi:hypothetical protein
MKFRNRANGSASMIGASSVAFSFPDVIGTLAPAIAAVLVNTVSTLGQIKNPALTHKPFPKNNKYTAGFLFFYFSETRRLTCSVW